MTADLLVPTMDRFTPAWPKSNACDEFGQAIYVPLADALSEEFDYDAHFAGYSLPEIERRLGMNAAGRPTIWEAMPPGGIPMTLLIVDCDAKLAGAEMSPAWWAQERAKVERAFADQPGFAYTTKGGYRLVWRLAEPHIIGAPINAATWSATYLARLDYLRDRYAIIGDRACADFPRLFRLPRVVRDGVMQEPQTIGDVKAIGTWTAAVEVGPVRAPAPRVEVADPTWDENSKLHLHAATVEKWRGELRRFVATRRRMGDRKALEQASLIERVVTGEALTTAIGLSGQGRHNSVYRAAQIIGTLLPDIGPEAAAALLRPSIEAIGNLEPKGLNFYLDKVREDYTTGVKFLREAQERQRLRWAAYARSAETLS